MHLTHTFFDRDVQQVAIDLLGKVLRHNYQKRHWLAAKIIETEAYDGIEKASHAALGYTEKRKALFMPAGTIYMYYARGGDSMNVSCRGAGSAVLIKSAWVDAELSISQHVIALMQSLNPVQGSGRIRSLDRLCSGQTLLCRALGIKVIEWGQQSFNEHLYMEDIGYQPACIIQTRPLGIPKGRNEHLLYRFVDEKYAASCTKNPLHQRAQKGIDYNLIRTK